MSRWNYRKVPKFSDARKLFCNLPKIQTMKPNLSVFRQKNANGIANSEDPDQIRLLLEEQSDLRLHCLPRPFCPKLRIITVSMILVQTLTKDTFLMMWLVCKTALIKKTKMKSRRLHGQMNILDLQLKYIST